MTSTKYLDNYGELPSTNTICENYPTLDDAATNLTFDYALDTFKDQVLFRQVVGSFQKNKAMLLEKPKDAYAQIVTALQDIGLVYDEDITNYDSGHIERYNDWKRKHELRQEGMMGIPTSFKSINDTGVGWMPGELISHRNTRFRSVWISSRKRRSTHMRLRVRPDTYQVSGGT